MRSIDSEENDEMKIVEIKQMILSIVNTINNVEIAEIEKKLKVQEIEYKHIDFLNILMGKIANSEATKTFELVKQRISAIRELQKMMEQKDLQEKFFEEHLYKHPWLINPFWNLDEPSKQPAFEAIRQKYFKIINNNGEQQKNFIDILIKVAEERYPIIVELKKNTPTGHAKVKYTEVYDQIQRYRQAVIQNLPSNLQQDIKEEDVKAYFIISEDVGLQGAGNTIEFSEKEIKLLKDSNIELLKYNQIIHNALASYGEFINIIEKENSIPNFD